MAQTKLTVGDPAPKLQTGRWVQGEPVSEFKPGTVYILEFWATWCGPCHGAVPHLNELWMKFRDKGVIVIGQDVWDSDAAVEPFVKKMGDQMTYRVALDDKSQLKPEPQKPPGGYMAEQWMKAAEQFGIPTVFVINRAGRIAWIGHPMVLNEQLLEDILADRFDFAKFAVQYESHLQATNHVTKLRIKLFKALKNKVWDAAETALAELKAAEPESGYSLDTFRFEILLGRKNYCEAYQLAESLSDAHPDDAMMQNMLAWTIVAQAGLEKRDLALAERIAVRANQAAHGKQPAILDTLARAQFMAGKTNEAIATEQKAMELAPDEEKEYCKNSLAHYQKGKLPEVKA